MMRNDVSDSFWFVLGLLMLGWGWQSCQSPESIAQRTFEPTCWNLEDTISFSLHPSQVDRGQLNITVDFLPDYPYANLYLKLLLTGPSGRQEEIMVNDTVLDQEGNWLSKSGGGSYSHTFDPAIPIELPEAGTHQVQLFQYMRDTALCEIQAIRIW